MPQSILSDERLRALLKVPLTEAQMDDLLFVSKAEVDGREGDALTISVTPDRLDLLSEAGLAFALEGGTDAAHGLPGVARGPSATTAPGFEVDPSVAPLRPYLQGVIVRAPEGAALDAGTLAEAIRFQELLHATIGRDRRAASLGIYPWDRLSPPIRYALEPLGSVRFVPLDGTEEIPAEEFFRTHPLAARYGTFGQSDDRCLVLRDRAGTILSLPPVLNSRTGGEARAGDRELLLEATGTRERSVREMLGLLLVVFAGQGWSVTPVEVVGPGDRRDDGAATVAPHAIDLPSSLVHGVTGEPLSAAEIERRLGRARLYGRPHPGGWRVEAPPWRPDLLTPIDVVEDLYLAAPIRPDNGRIPPSTSRGHRRAETIFRRRCATELLGLGFAAPYTSLLVSEATVGRVQGSAATRIQNPVSMEFAYLRDRLLLSHLDVLARNTRHAYPQRFAEVGPVIVRNPSAEAGAETRYHAGLLIAADTASFSDAAAVVDYLLRGRDVSTVREPTELPATIPGRAARARVAGEAVAEMGEIHPRVLSELGVPVPAVWAEIDLTALWPMVARHDLP